MSLLFQPKTIVLEVRAWKNSILFVGPDETDKENDESANHDSSSNTEAERLTEPTPW